MTLQQLRYIVAIDQHRHFGQAAEACGLTQSTLSLMVKKLEEELDVRIFDREAHPVTPTAVGRRIIDQAKVALYQVDQISEMTRSEKEALSGPLRIALISTVSPVLVPGMFKYIGANHPAISLQAEEMLSATIKEKLRKAEVDMGILAGPVEDRDLLEVPLYHERFLAYLSADHPLASREELSVEDLSGQTLWIIRNGIQLMPFSDIQREGALNYERLFEGGRVGLLLQIVNENGGMTVVPETHRDLVRLEHRPGLRPITGEDRQRTVSLVVRSDYIHEAMLNAVVQAVKAIVPRRMWDSVVRGPHLVL